MAMLNNQRVYHFMNFIYFMKLLWKHNVSTASLELCQGEPEIFESKPALGSRAPCRADQAFALCRWNGTELTELAETVVVQLVLQLVLQVFQKEFEIETVTVEVGVYSFHFFSLCLVL